MAGLYEHWLGADGSELETMAILTTDANDFMAPIHYRMPVILAPDAFDFWLDCRPGTAEDVLHLLRAPPNDLLEAVEIQGKLPSNRAKPATSADGDTGKLI